MTTPPFLQPDDKVVLFDGVCNLCSKWSNFLLENDRSKVLKLCTLQSEQGRGLLEYFGLPTDTYDTMLYVENGVAYKRSDAFIAVVSQLPFPYSLIRLLKVVPRSVRNWFYDRIALNRYRLFGKYDYCSIPSKEHLSRFIDH